jgi:hypothetical protein
MPRWRTRRRPDDDPHAVQLLECGRYMDALQVTIGDAVSPLWTGLILVAANPRRVLP